MLEPAVYFKITSFCVDVYCGFIYYCCNNGIVKSTDVILKVEILVEHSMSHIFFNLLLPFSLCEVRVC